MGISLEEVRRLEALADLESDRGAEERLREDLERILGFVGRLAELELAGVAPALAVTAEGGKNLRDDSPGAPLSVEEVLANAPSAGRGHFKVPRVAPG